MASRDDEEEEEEEEEVEVVEETTAKEKKEKKKSTSIRGVKPTDAPMMFMGGYEEISMAMAEEKSKALFAETDIPKTKVPICEICTGFLVSLPCGHDGCVRCLQKVQWQSSSPFCSLCRTNFHTDASLCLDSNLRETLARVSILESNANYAQNEAELYSSHKQSKNRNALFSERGADVEHNAMDVYSSQKEMKNGSDGRKYFVYDHPLPEETGSWIPVSVPPTWHSGKSEGENYCEGHFFPERCNWLDSPLGKGTLAPDLTTWRVLIEVIAFLCGARKSKGRRMKSSQYDALLCAEDTDYLAFSLSGQMEEDIKTMSYVLASEPPQWLPDSMQQACMQCESQFYPITCSRHHCRYCGGIFCGYCTSQRALLPVKFREKSPQRVCDCCYERLAPVQGILIEQVSNAAQLATHDVTDLSCIRSWLNNPLGLTLEHEIYKATNTLQAFSQVGTLKAEVGIPDAILRSSKGLAIFTVLKVGAMVTYKMGTGLVLARRPDGSWSPPSAIMSCGVGWGPQVGGEVTDFIVILRNEAAVRAFGGRVHVSLGAGVSVAVGPVGRILEADLRAGDGGTAACYTYSMSKGVFAGCSLEGNIVMTRASANVQFYGDPSINAAEILLGSIKQPKAAVPLYVALSDLFRKSCA